MSEPHKLNYAAPEPKPSRPDRQEAAEALGLLASIVAGLISLFGLGKICLIVIFCVIEIACGLKVIGSMGKAFRDDPP